MRDRERQLLQGIIQKPFGACATPISNSFSDNDSMNIVKHVLWTVPLEFLEAQLEDALPTVTIRLRGLSTSQKSLTMSFDVSTRAVKSAIRHPIPEDARKEAAETYKRLVMSAFAEEPDPSFLSFHRF